jgi:hypothetical protein
VQQRLLNSRRTVSPILSYQIWLKSGQRRGGSEGWRSPLSGMGNLAWRQVIPIFSFPLKDLIIKTRGTKENIR